ncbi:MAG TPA: hypothetical protein IGS17_18470 [Oscillatoriales cyanobacterium M59_W2019_021]|nr:hypothetical protein [Oscillatoriales cyanobacterium M59_W2019_021]
MLDPSANPLLVSAGITTSLTCAISGYALYELLSVGPEPTDTARAVNPQLRRQPIIAKIVPDVSAPESWTVRPGQRPDFLPLAEKQIIPEGAIAESLILMWKQGKLPEHLAPLIAKVEAEIDEFEAKSYLEAARIQATQEDYAKALNYLKKIPHQTSSHSQAQVKIAEYTEQQTLQAKAWMRKANALAQLKDFSGARIYLKQVPETNPVYPSAQNKMAEYAQTQNVQANFWFEEATKLASQGKLSDAISYLKRIPMGTSIYTVAQTKMAEYSQKQNLNAAMSKPVTTATTPTQPPKPKTPAVTPTPAATVANPMVTPNPTAIVAPAKPEKPETPAVTPNPTAMTEILEQPSVETPLPNSGTPAIAPNPRAAAVSPVNPIDPAPVTVDNSIAPNPQNLQTPAPVLSNGQPPQIRPEALQAPTFIPSRDASGAIKTEKDTKTTATPATSIPKIQVKPKAATPANALPNANLKSGTPKPLMLENSTVTPKLKRAPSDTNEVWNAEPFTQDR